MRVSVLPPPPILGTVDAVSSAGATTANRATFTAIYSPASFTATGVSLFVGTQSGNICVGLYDSAGNRIATSGSVACPAAGVASIAFSANVVCAPGTYYVAMSSDNGTSSFQRVSGSLTFGYNLQNSAFPLPTTLTLPGTANGTAYAMAVTVLGGLSQ